MDTSIVCLLFTIYDLDKAYGMCAQLYTVRVDFSGGAAPPTPLFARNYKVDLNLVLRLLSSAGVPQYTAALSKCETCSVMREM